ncbi:MAG: hypothetical protein Q4B23_05660 [Helcococcus sp.]|nr:hypothetical protein [Helcococcus sp.]
MKNKYFRMIIISLIILVIVLVGCRKVEDEVKWDNIPMFMYKDDFYYYKKTFKKEPPENIAYDGKFESTVPLTEIPTKNGQSNFGIYEYILIDDESMEVYLGDNKWMILSKRD